MFLGRRFSVADLHPGRSIPADRTLYWLFPDPENRRHDSFTKTLPSRRRLGL